MGLETSNVYKSQDLADIYHACWRDLMKELRNHCRMVEIQPQDVQAKSCSLFIYIYIWQMLSSVPAVVQTQHGEVILARATPLFLVCDMMLGGNLSCARKKRKRIASHNLKKTQHEASILGRFMLGNDDT